MSVEERTAYLKKNSFTTLRLLKIQRIHLIHSELE